MIPIFSILLTLALPLFAIKKAGTEKPLRRPYLLSIGSFAFCGVALIEELYVVRKRLFAGDISGLEDTIDAVLLICIALLVVTVLLNLLAMSISNERGTP